MSAGPFESASVISTHFRCHSCGISIDKVTWKQCEVCKAFNLCHECAKLAINGDLLPETLKSHQNLHPNERVNNDWMKLISVVDAEIRHKQAGLELSKKKFERILNKNTIRNDYEMAIVLNGLKHTELKSSSSSAKEDQVNSLVAGYHLKASERNIRVISLDGGGVRGYMPLKILSELITQKCCPHIEKLDPKNLQHKELFHEAQLKFTERFDYFAGTSTGGIIAFCLAIGYNILDAKEIYSDAHRYFKKNRFLGPVFKSRYDPSVIHRKIDDIIDWITFPGDEKISAENATLLDIRNLLNPDRIIKKEKVNEYIFKHGNFLEFVDEDDPEATPDITDEENYLYPTKREKILLITAYNTTDNIVAVFNTSYSKHWGYRIADVIKSTMAAPTYFPPHKVYKPEKINESFGARPTVETFIDGGVFANDPELTALWSVRMQWKKPFNYHILSIGTGIYKSQLSPNTWGGYWGWLFKGAVIVDTLMGAPGSFTEVVGANLAKFNNMRRMKLNYKLRESMKLDDPDFVRVFDQAWEYLKNEEDYKAFVYFYDNYIANSK